MDLKEFGMTVLAITLGIVLGVIVVSKLPTTLGGGGMWEESV
jgi:hypothetical protein